MLEDDYDEDQPDEDEESPVVRDLRKKASKADKVEREAQELRTENALLKANLGTLSERQRKAILATHDGDLTPEALKATALDLGFIEAEAPAPAQVPEDEQAEHQRAAEATSAAPASEATVTTLDDKIAAARSPEELDAILAQEGLLAQD
jgi:hypothetical protein